MATTKQFPLTFPSPSSASQRSEQIPPGLHLLLLDTIAAPATFVTLNFIAKALKERRPVLLVSCNESKQHWDTLLQKQGIQLAGPQMKGRFMFIDGLCLLHQAHSDLTNMLLESVRHEISSLSAPVGLSPLVIFDDLTTLIWSGLSQMEVTSLCRKLYASLHQPPLSIIIVFHGDQLDATPERSVFDYLVSRSDVVLRTRSLGAQGLGELSIGRGPMYLTDCHLAVTISADQTTQYRIEDNSVTYYPKGLDKGFI